MPTLTLTLSTNAIFIVQTILMVYIILTAGLMKSSYSIIVEDDPVERRVKQMKFFAFIDISNSLALIAFMTCEALLIIMIAVSLVKEVIG